MKAYKGFNKGLTCRGFQYKEGETFEISEAPKACDKGFHACEYPLDCLGYYEPSKSVYHEVEILGDVSKDSSDSKVATNRIKIGAELNFASLAKLSIEYTSERTNKDSKKSAHKTEDNTVASNSGYQSVASNSGYQSVASNSGDRSVASNSGYQSVASNSGDWSVASNSGYQSVASNSGDRSVASNSGYWSVASNSGYQSVASNSGYQSVASNSGYRSVASNSGEEGIAGSFGIYACAKGKKGTWLVLAEWKIIEFEWYRTDVKVAYVDGIIIKEDTLYKLDNSEFVEVIND